MRSLGFLFTVFLLAALAVSGANAAGIEGSVLFVAPHRLIVTSAQKSETINVTNKSNEARRYTLEVIDQVMDANGVTQRVETYPYSAKKMLDFRPRRFTLQPGQSQVVRVLVTRPADLADGDYHSHLLFREVPLNLKDKEQLQEERKDNDKTVTFEIRTLYGIGVPIVVQQGKIASDISMEDVKLGGKELTLSFARSGNAESAGKLSVQYVDGGKPVDVIDPQWVRLYREVDHVTKKFALEHLPADAHGGKIVLSLVKDEADPTKTVTKEIPFK